MILIRFCCPQHLLKTILLLLMPFCLPSPWHSSQAIVTLKRVSPLFLENSLPSFSPYICKTWVNMHCLTQGKSFQVEAIRERVTRKAFPGATRKELLVGFSRVKSLSIWKGVDISALCSSFSFWSLSDQWSKTGGRSSFQKSLPIRSIHLLTPIRCLQQGPAFPLQNTLEWVLVPGEMLSRSYSERTS